MTRSTNCAYLVLCCVEEQQRRAVQKKFPREVDKCPFKTLPSSYQLEA